MASKNLFMVTANVSWSKTDRRGLEWSTVQQIPSFIIDGDVLGFYDAYAAERRAKVMVRDMVSLFGRIRGSFDVTVSVDRIEQEPEVKLVDWAALGRADAAWCKNNAIADDETGTMVQWAVRSARTANCCYEDMEAYYDAFESASGKSAVAEGA